MAAMLISFPPSVPSCTWDGIGAFEAALPQRPKSKADCMSFQCAAICSEAELFKVSPVQNAILDGGENRRSHVYLQKKSGPKGRLFQFKKKILQQRPHHGQTGHDDGHHAHQLDEDVQAWAGGVLERIADSVAGDGRFVGIRTLAAVGAAFNILFRIVPGAACIGHKYGEDESGGQAAGEQPHDAGDAENQAHQNGGGDGRTTAADIVRAVEPALVGPGCGATEAGGRALEHFLKEMAIDTPDGVAALEVDPLRLPDETQVRVLTPTSAADLG